MYVYQLAKELIKHGHQCAILSISNIKHSDDYDGISIFYIPSIPNISQEQNTPINFEQLISVIKSFKPDIFHQHTLTPSLGVNHIAKLFKLGIKTIFTAHITSFSCIRGDLMLYGKIVCDGKLDRKRCIDCYLQQKGISNTVIRSTLTKGYSNNFLKFVFPSLLVYDNKLKAIELFKNNIHHLVVVSKWQQKLLLLNGFDENKVSVCRQAIDENDIISTKNITNSNILRIGFVGRIVKVKGLHLLLEILGNVDNSTFSLSIVGIKSDLELDYYKEVKAKANSLNVIWKEGLEQSEVIDFLDTIDLLVVPSTWLETGPYVIYEALARKVPVLAFNRGGAVELIENMYNGWLVNSEYEFRDILLELIKNKKKVMDISSSANMKRTTKDIYNEMIKNYENIIIS